MLKKAFSNKEEFDSFYLLYNNNKLNINYNFEFIGSLNNSNPLCKSFFELKKYDQLFWIFKSFLIPTLNENFGKPHLLNNSNPTYFLEYNNVIFSIPDSTHFILIKEMEEEELIETIYNFEKKYIDLVLCYTYEYFKKNPNSDKKLYSLFKEYCQKSGYLLKINIDNF